MICHTQHCHSDHLLKSIRSKLSVRHAMRIGELSDAIGLPAAALRPTLEEMRGSGDIERIRPVGYEKDDLDSFAMVRREGHPWDY